MMMASVFIGTCILQSNESICLVHMIIALCCAVKHDPYITIGNSDYRERKSLCTNKQKSLSDGTHTREDCVSLWAHLSHNRSTG